MKMSAKPDVYDDYADQYADWVGQNAPESSDPFLPHLLDTIGEVDGLRVLDAGCGEGYLARMLAQRGANVTGVDISPRLIQIAKSRTLADTIDFRASDLSQPLPGFREQFDVAASYFVLNDVQDYQGFITTLTTVVKPGGRIVVGMNNPYSFVARGHVKDYFLPGKAVLYPGLADQGIKVHFYQRTLAEYMDAFLATGLRLQRLVDVPTPESMLNQRVRALPPGYQFPYFLVLRFEKPANAGWAK